MKKLYNSGSSSGSGTLLDGPTLVKMRRADIPATPDQILWTAIRASTNMIGFNQYQAFMNSIMDGTLPKSGSNTIGSSENGELGSKKSTSLPFPHVEAYRLLKAATEVFLQVRTGAYTGAFIQGLTPGAQFPLTSPGLDDLLAPENGFNFLSSEGLRYNGSTPVVDSIVSGWSNYLNPQTSDPRIIPYLELIHEKLPEVGIFENFSEGSEDPESYERRKLLTYKILREKLANPLFLELLWSYWLEEGMLVQTMNALSMRFQNVSTSDRDPLAQLELSPLRPINNLLWGHVQDEQHRLSIVRRAYEYDHHYGLRIVGKALPPMRTADSRSKFLEAFHNLLTAANSFMQDDDQTTMIADGFPVLNALKDVHMLLTQGMHNQYGDLPWTARHEMLMQQYILSRPEMREFLPSRTMVAYPEPWMDRVDAMKRLQGWNDVAINHFRDLAIFGEQLLLAIRFGAWSTIIEQQHAANWVRYWRAEIQGYMYSYRAVTGIDLASEVVDTRQAAERYMLPALHIQNRMRTSSANRNALAEPRIGQRPII